MMIALLLQHAELQAIIPLSNSQIPITLQVELKNDYYGIQKNHKELTKNCITYLHRCFTYAMTQNRGGFHDPQLLSALQEIFHKLADNAEKYSTGASSNFNESLNATMASKAPKSRCYSTSASADFRFACAAGQKNIGEGYTQEIAKKVHLSPEKKKGVTYQSNCSLLSEPAVEFEKHYEMDVTEEDNDENAIILLDLETSGFKMNCDILQIGAKYNKNSFSIYVNPVRDISENATRVNGFTSNYGELLYHGTKVQSVPLRAALGCLQDWLKSLKKRCYIVTHNLTFDGPRLLKAINKYCKI
ncbi:uncharacterized protein LOC116850084 [Odontomachus brunneus]|uniref:uncharacterized protein LOC116850084 n=1 Tax=Odontomachus brunneus TaxID=486640 RepID=UPI0013F25034|nr:uncharacterized protein LOC116850084 [Odontomachus brunneus]